jgi:hypothetical protein
VDEELKGTQAAAQPEQAQPEQTQPEQAQPEQARPEQARPEQAQPEQGQIMLDENGELNIPDDFWDEGDLKSKKPAAAAESEPKPEPKPDKTTDSGAATGFYSNSEIADALASGQLADAIIGGQIDRERIPEALRGLYDAMDTAVRRSTEAKRIEAEIARRDAETAARQAQQAQQTQAQPPSWEQLVHAAKVVAARNYLGISEQEFDEFNPKHIAAQQAALQDIRERATALARQENYVRQVKANFANLWAEQKTKVPDLDEIGERYFPQWRENLSVREARNVDAIISSDDMGKIRSLIERVVGDYRKSKNPARPPAGTAANAINATKTPPAVMSAAGGQPDEAGPGFVRVDNLGNMSIEEQAAWMVRNKFAV